MSLPALVQYESEEEYRTHFEAVYCRKPIPTFDGFSVRFRKRQFEHCFFESSGRDRVKDCFSKRRAERIDWIQAVLQDPEAELYQGWDRDNRCHDQRRRVAVVLGEYVVVIMMVDEKQADFITAYLADPPRAGHLSSIQKIRRGPKWQRKNR